MSMLVYIICVPLFIVSLLILSRGILLFRGARFYEEDGLAKFFTNSKELWHFILRFVRHFRKVGEQYVFHALVRSLYYVKLFFHDMYAYARKRFMKTVIQDKKAVSRFWEHLKEYKQEIDKEKEKEV